MDVLAQLEMRVEQLLARLEMQKSEISRLEAEMAGLRQENTDLTSANRLLEESLRRNKAARREALTRLDSLIQRIQNFGGAE